MFGGKTAEIEWDNTVRIESGELDYFLSVKEAWQSSCGSIVGDSIVSNAIKYNSSSA